MSVAVQIEKALDRVALAMERAGKNGDVYLPIYERLESELVIEREKEDRLSRARSRVTRFSDRTGRRSSASLPEVA